jgi:glycerol-3-phosphate acyltransferase PlsX
VRGDGGEPVIALDAMGGDDAPKEIVAGAVQAARQLGVRVALVGPPDKVGKELAKHGAPLEGITTVPAT